MKRSTPKHRTLVRRLVGLAGTITVSVALSAAPAETAPAPHHPFQVLCEAGGGSFALARFDIYRCQDARTDGMGVFWAERTACERAARRSFLEATDETGGRGTWLCVPALA